MEQVRPLLALRLKSRDCTARIFLVFKRNGDLPTNQVTRLLAVVKPKDDTIELGG